MKLIFKRSEFELICGKNKDRNWWYVCVKTEFDTTPSVAKGRACYVNGVQN